MHTAAPSANTLRGFTSLFCYQARYIVVDIAKNCFALNAHNQAELICRSGACNNRKRVPFVPLANLGLRHT